MAGGPPNLKGKVAVVTGATSGIGRHVAEELARARATTVVVGRSQPRVVAVAGEIATSTGNPEVYPIAVSDLAVRSEVVRVVGVLEERYPRVHILVNNAGAYFRRRELTSEGLERTFALNVLAPFLLTARLMPKLVDSAPSRVIMVASAAHTGQHVPFDDLQSERSYGGYRAYGRAKLEVILLAREFAHRLHDRPVTVNAVHPGLVASGFGRNNGGLAGASFGLLLRVFGRNVRKAARDVAWAASDPSLDKVSGEYLAHREVRPGSAASRDMVAALRLYDACALLAKPFL
jgi:NAD(P)-dependent dehydrogenase (short-subunit alcohol dehydrogenase family)